MTTPRDAIGLSERLRDDIAQLVTAKKHAEFAGAETGVRVKDPSLLLTDLTEAATALDALQGEIRQWANEVARYKAYAEKFEQENDALQARVKELEAENHQLLLDAITNTPLYSRRKLEEKLKAAESRATSAEQERDEAYERAAKVAEGLQCRNCNSVVPSGDGIGLCCGRPDYDSISDIPDAIRRLAAGTEKEGNNA